MEFVVLDRPFNILHVHGRFDYWVKMTVLERQFYDSREYLLIINRFCVVVYAASLLIRLVLFVSVRDWLQAYECSRFLFMKLSIDLGYFLNLVMSRRALVLIYRIGTSEFSV